MQMALESYLGPGSIIVKCEVAWVEAIIAWAREFAWVGVEPNKG